jgi:hypothetical protein
MSDSPLQRLARLALDNEDPGKWAAQQRTDRYTWQQIADQLGAKLGTPVSRETVRLWATPHLADEVTA